MQQLATFNIQWIEATCERRVILVLSNKRAMQFGLDQEPAVCEARQRFRQSDRNQGVCQVVCVNGLLFPN